MLDSGILSLKSLVDKSSVCLLYSLLLFVLLLLLVDFSIQVLSSGAWPFASPTTEFALPKEVSGARTRLLKPWIMIIKFHLVLFA